jgi:hypothetical protein
MPSISPLIARVFDDPHANSHHGRRENQGLRDRFASKGRKAKRR